MVLHSSRGEKNVTEEEIWRPIEGCDKYEVSNLGRVRSFRRYPAGKIMKPHINQDGYQRVILRTVNGEKYNFSIHRLVANAFIPNPKQLPIINHIDENKVNNHVSNLEWCSQKHNVACYMALHPWNCFGEDVSTATLTNEQAIEIYKLTQSGELTQQEIADLYGTSYSVVNEIKRGYRWSYITGQEWIRLNRNHLTEDDVRDIYRLAWDGKTPQKVIAKRYNTTVGFVSLIKNGRCYTRITGAQHVVQKPHITDELALTIYNFENKENLTLAEIGALFGVSAATVQSIQCGRAKSHITHKQYMKKLHGSAKFSEDDVLIICGLFDDGLSNREIADIYHTPTSVIYSIRNGITWSCITGIPNNLYKVRKKETTQLCTIDEWL